MHGANGSQVNRHPMLQPVYHRLMIRMMYTVNEPSVYARELETFCLTGSRVTLVDTMRSCKTHNFVSQAAYHRSIETSGRGAIMKHANEPSVLFKPSSDRAERGVQTFSAILLRSQICVRRERICPEGINTFVRSSDVHSGSSGSEDLEC